MPKSRNSRSASPHKSVSAGNIAEFERKTALQNVHDIFREAVDIDVIQIVLQECNWKGNFYRFEQSTNLQTQTSNKGQSIKLCHSIFLQFVINPSYIYLITKQVVIVEHL